MPARIRPSWDDYFLNIAVAVSARSHDAETQVGCVIVSPDKRILSCGYNGYPPGFPDDRLPNTRPEKYPFMVHAEANAIGSAYNRDLRGSTLYCTHTPCGDCVKLVLAAGIKRVVCKTAYVNSDWKFTLKLLRMGGVEVDVQDPIHSDSGSLPVVGTS